MTKYLNFPGHLQKHRKGMNTRYSYSVLFPFSYSCSSLVQLVECSSSDPKVVSLILGLVSKFQLNVFIVPA